MKSFNYIIPFIIGAYFSILIIHYSTKSEVKEQPAEVKEVIEVAPQFILTDRLEGQFTDRWTVYYEGTNVGSLYLKIEQGTYIMEVK